MIEVNALQHLRKQHGERQEEIAALLGMSAANLSGYERGTRPLTEEHINLLCDHFGVSADELLGREKPVEASPLPEGLRADLSIQLAEDVPGLNARAGDYALVERKSNRTHIPADCYILVDTPDGRGLRHYIRQPGVELLYNGDKAEVWTLNGEEMLDITFLGYVTHVLKSVKL